MQEVAREQSSDLLFLCSFLIFIHYTANTHSVVEEETIKFCAYIYFIYFCRYRQHCRYVYEKDYRFTPSHLLHSL